MLRSLLRVNLTNVFTILLTLRVIPEKKFAENAEHFIISIWNENQHLDLNRASYRPQAYTEDRFNEPWISVKVSSREDYLENKAVCVWTNFCH